MCAARRNLEPRHETRFMVEQRTVNRRRIVTVNEVYCPYVVSYYFSIICTQSKTTAPYIILRTKKGNQIIRNTCTLFSQFPYV